MKILLRVEPRYLDVVVLLVEDFNIYEALPCHDCLHETEVEAPDHDDGQNNGQRRHHNPILDIGDVECRVVPELLLVT